MILLWFALFVAALGIDEYIKTKVDAKFNTGFQLLFRIVVVISLIYYNVQDTDWFIRISNYERWKKIEQKRAEETKEMNEWLENIDVLDREECLILLKAKESLIPIEIKRRILFDHQENIEKITADIKSEIKLDRSLCEEHGISPYQQLNEPKDTGETCYDRAGPYNCE